MKPLFCRGLACLCLFLIASAAAPAQSGVLNPNDPIAVYNPQNPPAQPAYGQIGKWVKSNRLNWNTSSYKAYIYKGMAFRLKFPRSYQHGVSDGKTYPVLIFFHGRGEKGTIYDNEFQLYLGGKEHMNAVNGGRFDGFLLYPQNTGSFFNVSHYDNIREIIENFMVPDVKADINRIYVSGLSGGGTATWDFMFRFPKLVAAVLPISSASLSNRDKLEAVKYVSTWHFQGGLDNSPHPNTARALRDAAAAKGAHYKYTEYPEVGHSCWFNAWAEPDYFPYLTRAHKANPWPLGGRSEFCPGDQIEVRIGVMPGFDGYEWRRNGVVIPGVTGNELVVTSLGTYDVRIKRGNSWSVFSPRPLFVKAKGATVPPAVTIEGMMSGVIPALDGNAGVTLSVPDSYTSYAWYRTGSSAELGNGRTFYATAPGDYSVTVNEPFGCAAVSSAPFTVINANGPDRPDAARDVQVTTLSKTALQLTWSDNPAPTHDETGFEIYQASQAGGPYKLAAVVKANSYSYTLNGLSSNTTVFFKVRAVNKTAAALISEEVSGTTAADLQAPTTPTNLTITGSTRNSISLAWNASSDDVEVTRYDIYINGRKAYVTSSPGYTVYNLEYGKSYKFAIKARDVANNQSAFSNQVSGQPLRSGFNYKYYTFAGDWTALPDFNNLTADEKGIVANIDLSERTQDDNFAFLFESEITITTPGTYIFRTTSDAGSRLYLGELNSTVSPYNFAATPLVDNDGLHGSQSRDGSITLEAGKYPIAVTYFEQNGGENLSVSWKVPGSDDFVPIPDKVFVDTRITNNQTPAAPTNFAAIAITHKRIDLSWVDNSSTETGFEISRSLGGSNGYVVAGTTGPNTTSYKDITLSPNTSYNYRVRALGESGESSYAQQTAKTPALPPLPAAPTSLKAAAVNSASIRITWDDNAVTENKYELYRSAGTNANFKLLAKLSGSVTSFEDGGLDISTQYYYKVKAVNEAGASPFSNEDYAKPKHFVQNPEAGINESWLSVVSGSNAGQAGVTNGGLYAPLYPKATRAVKLQKKTKVTGGKDYYIFGGLYTPPPARNHAPGQTAPVSPPSIVNLTDLDVRGGQVIDVNVSAIHEGGGVTLKANNLPAFSYFTDNGDGTGVLHLAPQGSDAGSYRNITFTAEDDQGARSSKTISIQVSGTTDASPGSSFAAYINFNRDNPAGAPWNNTNNVPQVGSIYANLENDKGNPSGIDMTVLTDFSGENPFGMNTGNNSGIFPDNVIRSSWWLDANVASQLKISGLSQAMVYSFTFFGSRDGSGDKTTVYTINGKSVSLNCEFNVSNTVRLDNVRADENGEVIITVSLGPTASFGYLGAIVINASDPTTSGGTSVDGSANVARQSAGFDTAVLSAFTPAVTTIQKVQGSPNPFTNHVNIHAYFEVPQAKIIARLTDLNGSVVYSKEFTNVPRGPWTQRLDVSDKTFSPGMFILQLTGSGSATPATFKLLKVR